ncbi:MAG: choice-of-anchor U domain-containing protein, partial [Desulfobacterales bacterium]
VQADVNGNGVADDEEPGYSDLDNDGLNDNDQPLMRVYKSRKGQSLIGINAVEGVSQINCFTSIEPESIQDGPRPKLRYGLMVFNVTLDQIGATARFELYLPEKPRIEAKWYKYDPINGWYEFPVDNDGDKYFIEITDGGFGDADGVANGIIVDPIGLADMSNEVESVDALDTVDSGDSESTMDRVKNACFIQAAADRSVVDATDADNLQMVAFRFIYSGLIALLLAVAVIQVTGGRRGNRTHSSPRSNSRSRSA